MAKIKETVEKRKNNIVKKICKHYITNCLSSDHNFNFGLYRGSHWLPTITYDELLELDSIISNKDPSVPNEMFNSVFDKIKEKYFNELKHYIAVEKRVEEQRIQAKVREEAKARKREIEKEISAIVIAKLSDEDKKLLGIY